MTIAATPPSLADTVTRRLLCWSVVSVASGLPLAAGSKPLLRGMGQQFIAWGAIDGAIALAGRWSQRRKTEPGTRNEDIAKLRRLLLVNAGLDVFYVAGGLALALRRGQDDPYWRGVGLGIVVQGGFLLAFDLWHGLNAPEGA
ncbi:MAG TPA: hypothetical protein VL334_25650 [Anaerolineae bacterium]|nr:hypothetical protein [Anaerolineae bacterium]